jgi:type I pantothenate kinase
MHGPLVSDFIDFSVYLHAAEDDLEEWFVARFMRRARRHLS